MTAFKHLKIQIWRAPIADHSKRLKLWTKKNPGTLEKDDCYSSCSLCFTCSQGTQQKFNMALDAVDAGAQRERGQRPILENLLLRCGEDETNRQPSPHSDSTPSCGRK
jgi:hypothetical protein